MKHDRLLAAGANIVKDRQDDGWSTTVENAGSARATEAGRKRNFAHIHHWHMFDNCSLKYRKLSRASRARLPRNPTSQEVLVSRGSTTISTADLGASGREGPSAPTLYAEPWLVQPVLVRGQQRWTLSLGSNGRPAYSIGAGSAASSSGSQVLAPHIPHTIPPYPIPCFL